MIKSKRSKSTGRAHLRLLPDATVPPKPSAPVEVPRFDSEGKPLGDRRVAMWHLDEASRLLARECGRTRASDRAGARECGDASAIARQMRAVLDPSFRALRSDGVREIPLEIDPGSIARMARECDAFRLVATRKEAEDWVLAHLPRSTKDARKRFPDHADADDFNRDGAKNLARYTLAALAAQGHADASKLLRRWGIDSINGALASASFEQDVADLASEVRVLWLPEASAIAFGRTLMGSAYRLLGLKRPFAASDRQRRRRDLAKK